MAESDSVAAAFAFMNALNQERRDPPGDGLSTWVPVDRETERG